MNESYSFSFFLDCKIANEKKLFIIFPFPLDPTEKKTNLWQKQNEMKYESQLLSDVFSLMRLTFHFNFNFTFNAIILMMMMQFILFLFGKKIIF